jgi:hypothetical protein
MNGKMKKSDNELSNLIDKWGRDMVKQIHIEKLRNEFMNCHSFMDIEIIRHLSRDFLKANPECYEMIFHARKRIRKEIREKTKFLTYKMN